MRLIRFLFMYLLLWLAIPGGVIAQDYAHSKQSISFSKALRKAKVYRNIYRAMQKPESVIAIHINASSDTVLVQSFFDNITSFKNLRKVVIDNYLDYNLHLPDAFWSLKKLEFVSLHNLRVDDFKGMDSLTELKYLSLWGSRLTVIPNEVYALKELEYLNLTLNFLTDISADITALTQLRELDLTSNCLIEIPESVTQLSTLEYLDINNVESSPNATARSHRTKAGEFHDGTPMCSNQLTVFPDLSNMKAIKTIFISYLIIPDETISAQIKHANTNIFK